MVFTSKIPYCGTFATDSIKRPAGGENLRVEGNVTFRLFMFGNRDTRGWLEVSVIVDGDPDQVLCRAERYNFSLRDESHAEPLVLSAPVNESFGTLWPNARLYMAIYASATGGGRLYYGTPSMDSGIILNMTALRVESMSIYPSGFDFVYSDAFRVPPGSMDISVRLDGLPLGDEMMDGMKLSDDPRGYKLSWDHDLSRGQAHRLEVSVSYGGNLSSSAGGDETVELEEPFFFDLDDMDLTVPMLACATLTALIVILVLLSARKSVKRRKGGDGKGAG